MVVRLVNYRRVSTVRQGLSGLGLEGQDMALAEYARATGATVIRTFTEIESGKRCDRPELAKALAACRREKATLCIAKLDRLARNVHFLSGLMESKAEFICCDMPNANRLTLHIMASVAEDEAKRISDRTKAALAAYKARGGVLGSARPNGHRLTGGACLKGSRRAGEVSRANADDAYEDIGPLAKELRGRGLSLRDVAKHLTDDGYRTRQGREWNAMQVKRIIERG